MVRANITDYGFDIQGHADFAGEGYDIVCSGISALTQSVAIELVKNCKAKAVVNNGWVMVEVEEPTELSTKLISVVVTGLNHIASDYPKHLSVRTKKGVFK